MRSVICSVCLAGKPVGQPDAGNPHFQFDERGSETERRRMQFAKLVSGRVVFPTEYPGKDFDGDGTVPRPSAKPRNFDKGPFFVVERHSALQNSALP